MNYPLEEYLNTAADTGVFNDKELAVLAEVLEELKNNQRTSYILLEDSLDGKLTAFIIFGRTPLTEFVWDIYWLVVNRQVQGKGIGKRLLLEAEKYICGVTPRAALRLETSTLKRFSAARGLYKKANFQEAGRLPNFYSAGDDLIIFYKENIC